MFLRIEKYNKKRLAGMRTSMSLQRIKTKELWSSFIPQVVKVRDTKQVTLYSAEVYNESYFESFDPSNEFEKWAGFELEKHEHLPYGLEELVLPNGLYAVFIHKGPVSEGLKTYRYIFETWMPESGYEIDSRPHFAVMGIKYKGEDPSSEEEIFIPIKQKKEK